MAATVDTASTWLGAALHAARMGDTQAANALCFDFVVVDEASQVRTPQLVPVLLATYIAAEVCGSRSRRAPVYARGLDCLADGRAAASSTAGGVDRVHPTLVLAGDPR